MGRKVKEFNIEKKRNEKGGGGKKGHKNRHTK